MRTVTTSGACEQSPHYHNKSDTVGASGNSIPLWTKCIKSNVAAMALLAGVIPPTEINNKTLSSSVSKLDVFYFNNTIHTMLPMKKIDGTIEIYDLEGRLVYKRVITGIHKNSMRINGGNFASGVYHIRLISKQKTAFSKFAITR